MKRQAKPDTPLIKVRHGCKYTNEISSTLLRKKVSILFCLAMAFLMLIAPAITLAAGLSRAWDPGFELRHNLDTHIYHYPSPYERVDTLSGRYNFLFTDVSLPGDGGLSLTIMHVWDPEETDYTIKRMSAGGEYETKVRVDPNPFSNEARSAFGMGWKVFDESIRSYRAVDDWHNFEPSDESGKRFMPVLIHTQDGMVHPAYPCAGAGCSESGGYWSEEGPSPCSRDSSMMCLNRDELYLTSDFARLEIHSESLRQDGDIDCSGPWKWDTATLYLPNGVTKNYSNSTAGHPCDYDEDELAETLANFQARLTSVQTLIGSSIHVEYTGPDYEDEYGFADLPKQVTMDSPEKGQYKVEFVYHDIIDRLTLYEGSTAIIKTEPSTWLKRLDVYHEDDYLYSRYYNYFHYPKVSYDLPIDMLNKFFGSGHFFLMNTFILDVDPPVNATHTVGAITEDYDGGSIKDFLYSNTPLDFFRFEQACFQGINYGNTGCEYNEGLYYLPRLSKVHTPFGQVISLNLPDENDVDGDHKIILGSSSPDKATYYPNTLYLSEDTQLPPASNGKINNCDPSDELYIVHMGQRIISRTENPPLYDVDGVFTERVVPSSGRKDYFYSLETSNTVDGVFTTIIINGTSANGYQNDHCFHDGTGIDPSNFEAKAYSLETEYRFYDHDSLSEDDNLWKLFLPISVTSGYGETVLSKAEYAWTNLDHPAISRTRSVESDGDTLYATVNHVYPIENVQFLQGGSCAINRVLTDSREYIPVLDGLTITRDGLTYRGEFTDHDRFGNPGSVTWTGPSGMTMTSTSRYKYSEGSPDDPYYFGVPYAGSGEFSFEKGTGSQSMSEIDEQTLLTERVNSTSMTASFNHDSLGNLTETTDGNGISDTFSNYNFGRPETVSLGNGLINMDYDYDLRGPASSASLNGNSLFSATYDPLGNVIHLGRAGDLHGSTSSYILHTSMAGDSVSPPEFQFHRAVAGRRTVTGNVETIVEYDGWGRPWRTLIKELDGSSLAGVENVTLYNACGRPYQVLPPHRGCVDGVTCDFDVDVSGNTYTLHLNGNIGWSKAYYDGLGRTVLSGTVARDVVTGMGNYTRVEYSNSGNQLVVSTTRSATLNSAFETIHTHEYTSRYAGPNPSSLFPQQSYGPVVDDGDSVAKTVNYTHDKAGRLINVSVASGGKNLQYFYEYDGRGALTKEVTPERGTVFYSHDAGGRVTDVNNPGVNGAISYTYDAADRVTTVQASGAHAVTYNISYQTGTGLPLSETGDWGGGIAYGNSVKYQNETLFPETVIEKYSPHPGNNDSFSMTYSYDKYGNVNQMDYDGDFKIVFERDHLGRVTGVERSDPGGGGTSVILKNTVVGGSTIDTYYPDGSPMRMIYGNDLAHDFYKIYEAGVPTLMEIYDLSGSGTLLERTSSVDLYQANPDHPITPFYYEDYLDVENQKYKSDNFYNPTGIEFFHKTGNKWITLSNEYDQESRLLSSNFVYNNMTSTGLGSTVAFTYDNFGNRLTKSLNFHGNTADISSTYTYDDRNRLIEVSGNTAEPTEYSYDAAGNVTSTGKHDYSFDLFDRLVEADGKVRFRYTLGGDKIIRETDDSVTLYYYGGTGELVCERKFSLPLFKETGRTYYIWVNGRIVAQF